MPIPQPHYYDAATVKSIPTDPGIYAFFIDFRYVSRILKNKSAGPVDLPKVLERGIRAHTLANPADARIHLTGTAEFSNAVDCRHTPVIQLQDRDPQLALNDAKSFAAALSLCSLLSRPIYVGITRKSLKVRYKTHRKKYEEYKATTPTNRLPDARGRFNRGGQFFHRLVRRRLEFRDLIFACVPLPGVPNQDIEYIEKVLHAFAAPPMSDKH